MASSPLSPPSASSKTFAHTQPPTTSLAASAQDAMHSSLLERVDNWRCSDQAPDPPELQEDCSTQDTDIGSDDSSSQFKSTSDTHSSIANDQMAYQSYLERTNTVYNLTAASRRHGVYGSELQRMFGDGVFPELFNELDIRTVFQMLQKDVGHELDALLAALNDDLRQYIVISAEGLWSDYCDLQPSITTTYRSAEIHFQRAALGLLDDQSLPANVPTERKTWPIIYLECLKLLLRKHPSFSFDVNTSPLRDKMAFEILRDEKTLAILTRFLRTYHSICWKWESSKIGENQLRQPIDYQLDYFWCRMTSELPVQPSYQDRYARPVKPRDEIGAKNPHRNLTAGLMFVCQKMFYTPTQDLRADAHRKAHLLEIKELLHLLFWGKYSPCSSGGFLLEIIALVVEYKPKDRLLLQVINQCTSNLLVCAAILVLLDIPFPSFGMVIGFNNCIVFAARAELVNGELRYMVQRVEDWGSLKDFKNYLKFTSFLLNHQRWFRQNVWRIVEERSASDSQWIEKQLCRVKGLQLWFREVNALGH